MAGMAVGSAAPKRSDAQRNREAILEAARELLGASADFTMSEVAQRAGVGQGTLYRNFADRSHLIAAVMEDEVDQVERLAAEHADDPDAFFVLLRALSESMVRSNALAELAPQDPDVGSALERGRARIRQFMAGPLQAAKTNGAVRRDLTVDDTLLVLWMIRGAGLLSTDPVARAGLLSRALTLALSGIALRG